MSLHWRNNIFSTFEEAQELSTGPWPGDNFPGAALPSPSALNKWIIIINPCTQIWTCALVLDVGPWTTDDENYVFLNNRPRAEQYKGRYCPKTLPSACSPHPPTSNYLCNGAGLDLFPATQKALRLTNNAHLNWAFINP